MGSLLQWEEVSSLYFCVWKCIKNLKGPPFLCSSCSLPITWVWRLLSVRNILSCQASVSIRVLGISWRSLPAHCFAADHPRWVFSFGWVCGWLSHARAHPGWTLPFLAGRVRISPNGKLVRCGSLARATCGGPCSVPAESVAVLPWEKDLEAWGREARNPSFEPKSAPNLKNDLE